MLAMRLSPSNFLILFQETKSLLIMNRSISSIIAIITLFVLSCGGGQTYEYIRPPVDQMYSSLKTLDTYTIILEDMDVPEEGVFRHKYRVVYPVNDTTIADSTTRWMAVDQTYFFKNEGNLGMALVSKKEDGTLNKIAAPAGYDNYVGNEKYGQWQTNSSGGSFWAFYGRYMFLSSLFHYTSPVGYRGYRTYDTSYRGSRPYYGGTSSNPKYGTSSSSMKNSKPSFFTRRASSTGWKSSRSSYKSTKSFSGSGSSRYNSSGGGIRGFGGGFGK